MSILPTEVPSETANDVACLDCGSTGPFEVLVYSLYSANARATRIADDGDVVWEFEPVDWDYCDRYGEMELTCQACGETFEIENHSW